MSTAGNFTSTPGKGFPVGYNSTIANCHAYDNRGDGINVFGTTVVRGNTCTSNGAAGIHSTGINEFCQGSRIEGNLVAAGSPRHPSGGKGNLIIKNSTRSTSKDYVIGEFNVFGEIVNRVGRFSPAVDGRSAPNSAGTADPWANFSH